MMQDQIDCPRNKFIQPLSLYTWCWRKKTRKSSIGGKEQKKIIITSSPNLTVCRCFSVNVRISVPCYGCFFIRYRAFFSLGIIVIDLLMPMRSRST